MSWNPTKWKATTWLILAALIGGSLASETAFIQNLAAQYPHVAPVAGLLISILTLLHSPVAQQIVSQFESTSTTPAGVETKVAASVTATKE